jgi:predicted metal-dependent enzyme (double-stranded beta helix superfamily)
MAYTFEDFCRDAHDAMARDPGPAGREAIRTHLEKLLANADFVATRLAGQSRGKTELYHDEESDFYVMAHGTDQGDRVGPPHDHGASWAVYGQAIGLTNMTVWDRTDDGSRPGHAELAPDRTFPLEPGRAALFDTGVIHSTAHPKPARWVRVTGTNLDTIERHAYDPERKAMKRMNAS